MTHLSTLVEIAAELRLRAGQTKPPFSTRKIIRSCFPDALVTGGNLPAKLDELVTVFPDGPVILYARALPGPEQRYAIAHALGHLIFDGGHAAMRPGCAGVPASEERADAFASELLAPVSSLSNEIDRAPSHDREENELYLDRVDEIASDFGLPAHVIDSQIRKLISAGVFVDRT